MGGVKRLRIQDRDDPHEIPMRQVTSRRMTWYHLSPSTVSVSGTCTPGFSARKSWKGPHERPSARSRFAVRALCAHQRHRNASHKAKRPAKTRWPWIRLAKAPLHAQPFPTSPAAGQARGADEMISLAKGCSWGFEGGEFAERSIKQGFGGFLRGQKPPQTFFNFFSKPPCALSGDMIHLRQFKDQTRPTKGLRRFANPNKPRVRLRETKQRRERKRKRDSDIRGQRRSPEIEPRPRPKESMLYFFTLRPRVKSGGKQGNEK